MVRNFDCYVIRCTIDSIFEPFWIRLPTSSRVSITLDKRHLKSLRVIINVFWHYMLWWKQNSTNKLTTTASSMLHPVRMTIVDKNIIVFCTIVWLLLSSNTYGAEALFYVSAHSYPPFFSCAHVCKCLPMALPTLQCLQNELIIGFTAALWLSATHILIGR